MADLTTVANVKAWLPVVSTADDALLARLVSAVSAWIQNWVSRPLMTATYTETLNGNGKTFLCFLRYPVTAVTSVTIDGVLIPARSAPGQSGWYFDSDFLYLDGYCFTTNSKQNVVLVYVAGFTTVPLDLEQATIELCAIRYRERDRIGLVSKGLAGETTTFFIKDLPAPVVSILNSYKRVVPVS